MTDGEWPSSLGLEAKMERCCQFTCASAAMALFL